jgi:hypothetical protein
MYDPGWFVLGNDLVDLLVVLEVSIYELDLLFSGDLLEPLKALHLRVVQIVQQQDVVALIYEFDGSV